MIVSLGADDPDATLGPALENAVDSKLGLLSGRNVIALAAAVLMVVGGLALATRRRRRRRRNSRCCR